VKLEVRHNPEESRFEAIVDGKLCRADYRMGDGVMRIVHTEVPYRLEGRGIAAEIVRQALVYARANGLKVAPQCGYVRAYMRRHKETHDLLADAYSV
jgi:predicted GNAT family acetyltransferase